MDWFAAFKKWCKTLTDPKVRRQRAEQRKAEAMARRLDLNAEVSREQRKRKLWRKPSDS